MNIHHESFKCQMLIVKEKSEELNRHFGQKMPCIGDLPGEINRLNEIDRIAREIRGHIKAARKNLDDGTRPKGVKR